MIKCYIIKNLETEGFYAVDIPSLGIFTQGKTLEEAKEMAKDVICELLDFEIKE
jgi:predicted RNase H-like HicB family nuclease